MNRSISLLALTVLLSGNAMAQDRMPPIPPEEMTEAQAQAVADYMELRGSALTGPPWSVILRVPDLVIPSLQLRLHNANNSALSAKLTELSILIAARHWSNSYEWNAHYNAAVRGGLGTGIIEAIGDGRRPEGMAEDEEIIYDFCIELLRSKSVSDRTYARALAEIGEEGIVEATSLQGYYAYLAMLMNVARSPTPANATQTLTPFPQ